MNSFPSVQTGRTNLSPVQGAQFSWRNSLSHPTAEVPANVLPRRSLDSSIDPQLRNDHGFSEVDLLASREQYPLASPQDHVPRQHASLHTRHTSLQLPSVEVNLPRQLPSQNVTDETFDDAYVAFILYCNPAIPAETDSFELRKTFRAPPKSDGKNFSTFVLFQLIRKLELKEIKTWAQLAIDLGVEPPSLDKGQSAQKVQQYAVRLKRWMHAMHVDAFFEFLLNKSHVYWTRVPAVGELASEFGRDGVIPEEDLALRALLPETRPKRGRRKAEDREADGDDGKSPVQRPRIHSPTLSDSFRATTDHKTPAVATVSHLDSSLETPWSAVEPRMTFSGQPAPNQTWDGSSFQGLHWRPRGLDAPYSAHPQSAISPHMADPFSAYPDEPRSAVTPWKSRARRRHGPAVSSAWPSSGNMSAGKLRGRPPSNRNVSDGPFSTFPANPNAKAGPTINLRETPVSTPVVDNTEHRQSAFNFATSVSISKAPNVKPRGLSLQVPERIGGAVRLATPPPTVLINGENLMTEIQKTSKFVDYLAGSAANDQTYQQYPRPSSSLNLGVPEQDSSITPPSSVELHFREEAGQDRTNIDVMEHQFINKVLGADWFDHQSNPIPRCTLDEAAQIVKQTIRNLRQESPSKETFLINVAALAGGRSLLSRMRMTRLEPTAHLAHFDAKWTLKFGAVEGSFNIKVDVPLNMLKKPKRGVDILAANMWEAEKDIEATVEDWKKRYVDLQTRISERDEKVRGLKTIVMNALVASQELNNI